MNGNLAFQNDLSPSLLTCYCNMIMGDDLLCSGWSVPAFGERSERFLIAVDVTVDNILGRVFHALFFRRILRLELKE
jgi:hypothetical protein